jgi:RluA family pseudouridine synthase
MTLPDHITPHQLPVLGYGAGWIALEKPAGQSVHNNPGSDLCSLLKTFFSSHPAESKALLFDLDFGVHPVHRLDKDTSGVILLACQREAFHFLARQFSDRKIAKRYLAVLHGHLSPQRQDEWLRWNWPLSKKAGGRQSPAGPPPLQACRTRYRVMSHTPHYTVIECDPSTGRKHQIRRHAKMAGHAIVGDRRYGTLRAVRHLASQHGFLRLALHAKSLDFRGPGRKKYITIQSPCLPSEIQALLNQDFQAERGKK